jgi:hypothetical protein
VKRLIIVIGLVVILAGTMVGFLSSGTAGAAQPTLTVKGDSAPGGYVVLGKKWAAMSDVNFYLDNTDADDVDSKLGKVRTDTVGNLVFQHSFGPMPLGVHTITAKQNGVKVSADFEITKTQLVDYRVEDRLQDVDDTADDIYDNMVFMKARQGLLIADSTYAMYEAMDPFPYPNTKHVSVTIYSDGDLGAQVFRVSSTWSDPEDSDIVTILLEISASNPNGHVEFDTGKWNIYTPVSSPADEGKYVHWAYTETYPKMVD